MFPGDERDDQQPAVGGDQLQGQSAGDDGRHPLHLRSLHLQKRHHQRLVPRQEAARYRLTNSVLRLFTLVC